jgi:alpha-L-fucosidase 2
LKHTILIIVIQLIVLSCFGQPKPEHDLRFPGLAKSWDEGIPLGNGMLGALIWEKDSNLRISLDRADLWDLRPVKEFSLPQFRFSWVKEQVDKGSYDTVQKLFDLPYDRDPGPSKIPAGALEFPVKSLGAVESVHLFLTDAHCEVRWSSGARFLAFVDANQPLGWFRYENFPAAVPISFDPPDFENSGNKIKGNVIVGQDLSRLGYHAGKVEQDGNSIYYRQKGWGDFLYEVSVIWHKTGPKTIEGCWSIATRNGLYSSDKSAWTLTHDAIVGTFDEAFREHAAWWNGYWSKSSIHLPDTILETQWYREIYKFGSSSRKGAPSITLQAVWTADNGNLPPWKGDYHNDLNTQLSYWPGYSSNHLDESSVFTDWNWSNRGRAKDFTNLYFGCQGLNYPGVSTLTGVPMGGWIQYALSPTTSAWLASHFYSQWKFGMDTAFLRNQGYPFVSSVAVFLDDLSVKEERKRQLPLSSSPEIGDNSIKAWYFRTTNYDLSLIRSLYSEAFEMARVLGKDNDAWKWKKILSEWPDLVHDPDDALMISEGYPANFSHRHFSHLMSIYPLGLVDRSNGKRDGRIIDASLANLMKAGTGEWCGYSYAWLGNLYARAGRGEEAANALRIFATCFCLPNSFHANGDQSKTGKSNYTYRFFTLEGNFAFASGIQEMLLQSQNGIVRVFPAVPSGWKEVSIKDLRARGAFLVSAVKKEGKISEIRIFPEKGGKIMLENPFRIKRIKVTGAAGAIKIHSGLLEIKTTAGQEIIITPLLK